MPARPALSVILVATAVLLVAAIPLTYNLAKDESLVASGHYYAASDWDIHAARVEGNGLLHHSEQLYPRQFQC